MRFRRQTVERRSSILAAADVEYTFTVMLIGDSSTGKTCVLIRFNDNTFMNNNFISTVGIDYKNKLVELSGRMVKLQVWDTAGQERFRSLTASYYRDADAVVLLYDVTNRASFENIRDWLAQIREYARESVQLTLVGNKMDLGQQRKVKPEEGKQLAKAYNIAFMETSAKTGQNVQEVFTELTKRLVEAADSIDLERRRSMAEGAVLDLAGRQTERKDNWLSAGQCCGGLA